MKLTCKQLYMNTLITILRASHFEPANLKLQSGHWLEEKDRKLPEVLHVTSQICTDCSSGQSGDDTPPL
jgi:hypothetical protein